MSDYDATLNTVTIDPEMFDLPGEGLRFEVHQYNRGKESLKLINADGYPVKGIHLSKVTVDDCRNLIGFLTGLVELIQAREEEKRRQREAAEASKRRTAKRSPGGGLSVLDRFSRITGPLPGDDDDDDGDTLDPCPNRKSKAAMHDWLMSNPVLSTVEQLQGNKGIPDNATELIKRIVPQLKTAKDLRDLVVEVEGWAGIVV